MRGKLGDMEEKVFSIRNLAKLIRGKSLSSFFGRALIAYTNADCALFNAGIFLGSLRKRLGHERRFACPASTSNQPLYHFVNGAELREIYEQSLDEEWPEIEIKGLGFRGTIMGAMIYEQTL